MNMKVIFLSLLFLFSCGQQPVAVLHDEPAAEDENISDDPMFDPMPEGVDPETGGPYVPIVWNTPSDENLPCVDGSGGCTNPINWPNFTPDPNGTTVALFPQNNGAGSIPPPRLTPNNDPGTQDLSKIFDRYGPNWLLEGVFGTQNGPQIPQSLPPSVVDIEAPALPTIAMPTAPSVGVDPAAGLSSLGGLFTSAVNASKQTATDSRNAMTDLQNTLKTRNAELGQQVSDEIEKKAITNSNALRKQLDDLKKKRDGSGTSSLQKIPSIDKPVPRPNYNTSPESVEGIAVRRAQSYIDYGRRTVESAPETNEGRKVAKQLIANSQEVLNSADLNYAQGKVDPGDAGLKLAYSLVDTAIALAPVAALAFGPPGALVAIGLEAVSVAKSWYEYKSGKSIWTGEALTPFQRDMALVNVGFAFVPAGTQLLGLGTSALRSAINMGRALRAPELVALPTAEKFATAFQKLPVNLHPQRVIAGSPNSVAIVGRSMGNPSEGLVGVNDVAKALQTEGFQVKTFSPSPAARADLSERGLAYANGYVPYEKVPETLMYQENKIWAEGLLQEGVTVIDIGNPNGLSTPSAFYDMEIEVLWKLFQQQ